MLLGGSPMLSTRAAISSDGITRRIARSMRANRTADSSTRVPTGTRAWIRICPPSTAGKKFLPRNGTSANEISTSAMKPAMKPRGLASARPSQPR